MDVSPQHDGLRRDGHDPLPGKRRREPRPDGREHAASGRAAAHHRRRPSSPPAWSTRRACDSGVLRHGRGRRHRRARSARPTSSVRYDDGEDQRLQAHQSSPAPTRAPASTSAPSSRSATGSKRARCIADGPSTDKGEIALGKNVLIGFMTWEGYNYEDAVLHQRAAGHGRCVTPPSTSRSTRSEARDTKLGPEEITRDIPNVGEDALQGSRRARHHPRRRGGAQPATSWSARSRPRARPS